MNVSLADKLKELRKAKNVSQEKLAEYLGISFQAVSKWENGVTSPDILLLPDIARYYGITVDELLQVEQIDVKKYFEECCRLSTDLFRIGKHDELIPIWVEAHKKLPNDIEIKEMLMSTYFDADKVKYQNEIIELATEIYNSNPPNGDFSYYQGQAISILARTYSAIGNMEKADEWARKVTRIHSCREVLLMNIHNEEDQLTDTFSFANHWYLDRLFYMAMRLNMCNVKRYGKDYVQKVNKTVADIFETVYPNDDMGFETLEHLCILHRCIAENEVSLKNDEATVRYHLERAVELALKSVDIKAHSLTHPLVCGWDIMDAPSDSGRIIRDVRKGLGENEYIVYQDREWYKELIVRLEDVL